MKFKDFIEGKLKDFTMGGRIPSVISKSGLHNSGAQVMNPIAVVNPSRPITPITVKSGKKQVKTTVAGRKH